MNFKLSVIISVYNREQYLEECLDSIVNQTLKDIEIIAVNDGSTDGSLAILERYARLYDNILVFTQRNQGAGAARNNGIQHARGRYLAFMDSDDYYSGNDCLEALYCAAQENDVSICGGFLVTNNNGIRTVWGREEFREYFCNSIVKMQDYPDIYGYTRYIYRADLIKGNNIWYAGYRDYEDQIFFVKALVCAGEFYGLDKEIYEYRVGYKTRNYTLGSSLDILCGIRDVIQIAKEYNLVKVYEHSLKNIHKIYVIPFYKYSFCGNRNIDETVEEINEMVTEWIGEGEDIILTKEKVQQMRTNCQKEYEALKEVFNSRRKKIIYGAGVMAYELLERYRDKIENIVGIAVTHKDDTSNNMFGGFYVGQIDEYIPLKMETMVVIATTYRYQDEIEKHLRSLGFQYIVRLDMRKIGVAER